MANPRALPAKTQVASHEPLHPIPVIIPTWIDLHRIFGPALVGAIVLDLLLIISLALRG